MNVLAIDTATEMCSVALQSGDAVFTRQKLAMNQHSNLVLNMVDEVTKEAELALSQLDLIICDVGPGSFTGIRIGIGVAQGLAYGAAVPLLGVDALSVLAQAVNNDGNATILAAIDARMSQIYWACFMVNNSEGRGDSRLKNQTQNELYLSAPALCVDIEPKLKSRLVVGIGSGWDAYSETLQAQFRATNKAVKHIPERFPLAIDALAVGLAMPQKSWIKSGSLLPVYLRNNVAKVSKKSLL